MNKMKPGMYIILILFALLCTINFIWMICFEFADTINYENREMAKLPHIDTSNYSEYSAEFEDYYNDNMPFRNLLIRINSYINCVVFKQATSNRVVLGKDKWLFYASETDGNPIGLYEGSDLYDEKQIERLTSITTAMQEEFQARGIGFALLFAPNKGRIYAEYVPKRYNEAEYSRTDILAKRMEEKGINVVCVRDDMQSLKTDYQLYYAYDTHWNQLGAYVAVTKVLSGFGIESLPLNEREIISTPLKHNYHKSGDDDLAKMLNLRGWYYNDELEFKIRGTYDVDFDSVEDEMVVFKNPTSKSSSTLLLVGDSFRISMLPALLEEFQTVYCCHMYHFSSEDIDKTNPDYVIMEFAERYSERIEDMEKKMSNRDN